MQDSLNIPPPLVSVQRITTLIASLIVALCSGTNYVYSAYSPQLGSRLGISHTQLNIVALAGNVGVYSSGPIWGKIVDSRGPRILLVSAFVFLLGGYAGMRYFYDRGLPAGVDSLGTVAFCALVLLCYLTGAGGNGGLVGAVNSTAKSFPDKARASTTGLVISGFGLSAFFFSTISHLIFAGNTSAFLLVLALGTSCPMIMGFFFVRAIPLPEEQGYEGVQTDEDPDAVTSALIPNNSSNSHLLASQDHSVRHRDEGVSERDDHDEYSVPDAAQASARLRSLSRGAAMSQDTTPNVHGKKLWISGDFWLLFSILSMLSGTGLMYINNVGSMSQALYAHNNPNYDDTKASGWQAAQVSTISLMNFSGRIFIGLVSDFAKNKYDIPRSYCLVLVSFFFFISQVTAATEDRIEHLWLASALLGLAHGSVFSLFPTVCLDWFGLPHFSENWGYLSMSPIVAGNLFSVIFGRNLDAHDGGTRHIANARRVVSAPQCREGLKCYVDTIYLTAGATFLSMLLSIWAGYRDRQKIILARRRRRLGSGLHA